MDQRGSIKPFLWILFVLALVYVAIKFVGPYYHYYSLKWDVQDIMKFEYYNPAKYRDLIYEKVLEYSLPISREDIEIERTGERFHAHIEWSEDVVFPGGYTVTLDFEIDE